MTLLRLAAALAALSAAACAGYAAGRSGGPLDAPAAGADDASTAAPAYMIVLGTVHDRAAFGAGYAAKLPALYEKFGGRYLAIGGGPALTFLEGPEDFASFVVAEWPSKEAALAFWNSPEYAELRDARIDGGWGDFQVFLVDGLAAPTTVSPMARPDGDAS